MVTGIYQHFSSIATRYNDLRTTDLDVVEFLAEGLRVGTAVRVADVGCGSGRYDIELLRELGDRLDLICVDFNFEMLHALHEELQEQDLRGYHVVRASARELPFLERELDGVFTLNAIHHFDAPGFLNECARVLQPNGQLFVYTRTRSQNRRNIWGRHFPCFAHKERRLFESEELERLIEDTPGLLLEAVEDFKYERLASLDWLLEQARNHHYSTFALYEAAEFEAAMKGFHDNILRNFHDPMQVTWQDENTLLVVRRDRGRGRGTFPMDRW
ncbi:MAG: class I SAM-dependent methyltransferase [Acidobacteriota bacterium]